MGSKLPVATPKGAGTRLTKRLGRFLVRGGSLIVGNPRLDSSRLFPMGQAAVGEWFYTAEHDGEKVIQVTTYNAALDHLIGDWVPAIAWRDHFSDGHFGIFDSTFYQSKDTDPDFFKNLCGPDSSLCETVEDSGIVVHTEFGDAVYNLDIFHNEHNILTGLRVNFSLANA